MKYKYVGISLLMFSLIMIWSLTVLRYKSFKDFSTRSEQIPSLIDFKKDIEKSEIVISEAIDSSVKTLLSTQLKPGLHDLEKHYFRNIIDVWGNHKKTLPTNTYVNAGVDISSSLKNFMRHTDHLENIWIDRYKSANGLIAWQYAYHLSSNTIRMHPWIDFPSIFGPVTTWTMVRFLDSIDKVNSFSEKAFCTRPYDDAGGTGLGVSCCRIVKPTPDYQDTIVTCADYSFRNSLQNLRRKMLYESTCIDKIAFKSYAPAIAYEPEAIFDLRTSTSIKGEKLIKDGSDGWYIKIGEFLFFNLNVFAFSTCR